MRSQESAMTEPTNSQQEPRSTDFGFEKVDWREKAARVRGVFESVAGKYDVMNDLMSLGVHRLWKRFTLSQTGLRPGQSALDVAGGTGDLAIGMARQVGKQGRVVLSDINPAMLEHGRDRLIDAGLVGNVTVALADAESLPFESDSFDCVTIGFGLRNVTDKLAALRSMYRVLKPGGQLLVLEFSTPTAPGLKPLYDAYSFKVLPALGKWVAHDEASYRYLAESIRMHPDQEAVLALLREAGFAEARYHNLSGGIVALHRGYKI
jgi:demethylmenaquinone methyltransferase / 2-methoxy-6-polyprenyl-1,4-benzoquinol methylase